MIKCTWLPFKQMITLNNLPPSTISKLAVLRTLVLIILLVIIMFTTTAEVEQGFLLIPHIASGIIIHSLLPNYIGIYQPVSKLFINIMSVIAALIYFWMVAILIIVAISSNEPGGWVYYVPILIYAANALYYLLFLLHKSKTYEEVDNYLSAYAVIPFLISFIAFYAISIFNLQLNLIAFLYIVMNISMLITERKYAN